MSARDPSRLLHPYTDGMYPNEEAVFDAAVSDCELRAAGVIEDDEPSAYSHYAWMYRFEERARGDFTPGEREQIRAHLGIAPFDAAHA
jgi:hypothetical protein